MKRAWCKGYGKPPVEKGLPLNYVAGHCRECGRFVGIIGGRIVHHYPERPRGEQP